MLGENVYREHSRSIASSQAVLHRCMLVSASITILALVLCSCGTKPVAAKNTVNLPLLPTISSAAVRTVRDAGHGDASERWSLLGTISKPVVIEWECKGPRGIRFTTAGKTLTSQPECGQQTGVVFSTSVPVDLLSGQKLEWTASKRTEWRVVIYEK